MSTIYQDALSNLGKEIDQSFTVKDEELDRLNAEIDRLNELLEPKPPIGKMVFGCSAPAGIEQLEATIGCKFGAHRSYASNMPTSFGTTKAAQDVLPKRMSIFSAKNSDWSVAGIEAGLRNLALFGKSWPASHPGKLILNHEPENDGRPAKDFLVWQAEAVALWHTVCPHVPIGGNLMSWSTVPASGKNPHDWVYAGWDFLSWDGYAGPGGLKTAEEVFTIPARISAEYELPFAIAEYGCDNDTLREKFTRDGAEFCAAHNGLFCTYWNSSGTARDYPWKPKEYPLVRELCLTYPKP